MLKLHGSDTHRHFKCWSWVAVNQLTEPMLGRVWNTPGKFTVTHYGPVLPLTENQNTNEDRLAPSHVCMKYLTRLSSLNTRSDVFCFVLECQTMKMYSLLQIPIIKITCSTFDLSPVMHSMLQGPTQRCLTMWTLGGLRLSTELESPNIQMIANEL